MKELIAKPKRRALSQKNYPKKLGLQFYAVVWLLMDRLGPPMWVWGMVVTLCAIFFIVSVIDICSAEDVEL